MKSRAPSVQVAQVFESILSQTMRHVASAHGEAAAHHLFFELYDHTFAFLEREFGRDAVVQYWNFIADNQLGVLEDLMKRKGFAGMEEYWRATLGQEGADYTMKRTRHSFAVRVKRCPPNEWFKSRKIAKYPAYCEHCRTLYQRVGERCGYRMEYFPPDQKAGTCCGIKFVKNPSA